MPQYRCEECDLLGRAIERKRCIRVASVWITVLLLAIVMSFEPSRPIWVPLMLARPHPKSQLFALFSGCMLSGLGAGLLVLFTFRQTPIANDTTNGATAQIGIGLLSLLIAAVMATKFSLPGRKPAGLVTFGSGEIATDKQPTPRAMEKMSNRARTILRKGNSPWLSGGIGLAIGATSLEFLAALVVIASSGVGKMAEIGALVMFLVVGNALISIPLATFFFAPQQTSIWIERVQNWLRTRGRREFAAILATMGIIQLAIGLSRV